MKDIVEVPKPIRQSIYREEIDNMLSNGDTYTAISNWLRNNGEVISRNVIAKYHKFCFNINEVALELYEQEASDKRLKQAAVEAKGTLDLYDKFIALGNDVVASALDDRTKADLSLKAAKQREDFMKEHGDQAAEVQTQLLKEIRDELLKGSLDELIRGMSDERTKKRIQDATE